MREGHCMSRGATPVKAVLKICGTVEGNPSQCAAVHAAFRKSVIDYRSVASYVRASNNCRMLQRPSRQSRPSPASVIRRGVAVSRSILPRIEFPGARHRHGERP